MVDGNVSTVVVDGTAAPVAGDLSTRVLIAEPDTEQAAEAESIGSPKKQEQKPVSERAAQPAEATADAGQPESVEDVADAEPQPEAEEAPITVEQAAKEYRKLLAENKALQSAKDREIAAAQAKILAAEQEREVWQAKQAAYEARQKQYAQLQEAQENARREAQKQKEAADFQRELESQPPEVQTAFKVAMQYVQQQDQRRAQEGHQAARDKWNGYLMQGYPPDAFQGLPKDRPLTPDMVDYAAARYADWRYMQDTQSRPKFQDVWASIKANKGKPPVAPPAAPKMPPMPQPPSPAPKPIPARVTPGTTGRPPSSLQAQFNAAIAEGDIARAEKLEKQLSVQYGSRSSD
jgi:hypothetical protein